MYCHTCNVESGPTLFCHVCDAYLPAPIYGFRAGVARRFAAVVIDIAIFVLLGALSLGLVMHFLSQGEGSDGQIALVSAAFAIALTGFFIGLSQGQTFGKRFLCLRVVDKRNGQYPGFGRMLLRETLAKYLSAFFLSLGFFWAIWDRDGQAWHDKIANTVVLLEAGETGRPRAMWPLLYVASFLLVVGANLLPDIIRTRPATAIKYASQSDNTDSAIDRTDAETKQQIAETIATWATAFTKNDPQSMSVFYAERLDRYFLKSDVPRSLMLQDKQAFLDHGNSMKRFTVSDLRFESITNSTATLTLFKSWVYADNSSIMHGGHTKSRVWMKKGGDGWVITSEQDLK